MPTIRWKDKTVLTPDDDQDRIPITDDTDDSDHYTTATLILGDLLKSGKDLSPVDADKGFYTSSSDTLATFDLSSAGRALIDDADATAQRTTLGLGGLATLDPADLESGGSDELEIALSQIPSINSQASTFLGAATVLAQQQALELEKDQDVPSQSSFDTLDGEVLKLTGDQTATGIKEFQKVAVTCDTIDYLIQQNAADSINFGFGSLANGARMLFNNSAQVGSPRAISFTFGTSFGIAYYNGSSSSDRVRILNSGTQFRLDSMDVLIGTSTSITSAGIHRNKVYTLATLPTSGVVGDEIVISDGSDSSDVVSALWSSSLSAWVRQTDGRAYVTGVWT